MFCVLVVVRCLLCVVCSVLCCVCLVCARVRVVGFGFCVVLLFGYWVVCCALCIVCCVLSVVWWVVMCRVVYCVFACCVPRVVC